MVVSSACGDLAVRSAELMGGVGFRLNIFKGFGVGFTVGGFSGCFEKTLSHECGVSCFVYAMERGTERTTTGFDGGSAVDG